MAIKKMQLSWIVVTNLKNAVQFFESLGLKLKSINEQFGWAELFGEDGESRLGIAQVSDYAPFPPGNNAVVTMTVDSVEKSKAELSKNGMINFVGDIIEIPGHVKLQHFTDADGNNFQLVEEFQDTP